MIPELSEVQKRRKKRFLWGGLGTIAVIGLCSFPCLVAFSCLWVNHHDLNDNSIEGFSPETQAHDMEAIVELVREHSRSVMGIWAKTTVTMVSSSFDCRESECTPRQGIVTTHVQSVSQVTYKSTWYFFNFQERTSESATTDWPRHLFETDFDGDYEDVENNSISINDAIRIALDVGIAEFPDCSCDYVVDVSGYGYRDWDVSVYSATDMLQFFIDKDTGEVTQEGIEEAGGTTILLGEE